MVLGHTLGSGGPEIEFLILSGACLLLGIFFFFQKNVKSQASVVLLAVAVALAIGAFAVDTTPDGGESIGSSPVTLSVTEPEDGSEVPAGEALQLAVDIQGGELVDESTGTDPTKGHLHIYVDGQLTSMPSVVTPPRPRQLAPGGRARDNSRVHARRPPVIRAARHDRDHRRRWMRRRRRQRFPELRTERLILRPTTADLGPDLVAAKNRSLPELRRWMAWADGEDDTGTLEFAARAEKAWELGVARNFCMVLEGEIVGNIGLDQINGMIGSAMLGYWIRSDIAGRGLMTEGAGAVVSHAFDDVGLHRIELHAALDNHGSIRVAEKLGFQRRGILRDATYADGAWMDVYAYDLLATDPPVS